MGVTIKDIAKAAGVDPSTVSRTLSDSPRVKDVTKKRIMDLCAEMGYTPNAIARSLVKRGTKIIGMLVPDISNNFYSEMMALAGEKARELGFDMMWYNSFQDPELEKKYFKHLIEYQADAIIFHPINGMDLEYYKAYVKRVPTVFIGDIPETSGICCVSTDNALAGRVATKALIDRGCKRISFVGAKRSKIAHYNRINGYMEEVKANGLIANIPTMNDAGLSTTERAYQLFSNLIDIDFHTDGIVAVNDNAAMGILKACAERNIRIPEDIQIVGFDDLSYTKFPYINLSTVSPGRKELIDKAMEMACLMMGDGIIEKRMIVSPKLIVRGSLRDIT